MYSCACEDNSNRCTSHMGGKTTEHRNDGCHLLAHCHVVEVCRLICADSQEVRQHLNMRWGVMPFRLDFEADPEANVSRTFRCGTACEMLWVLL